MDVWWGICVFFMTAAILEYAYLLRARLRIGPIPIRWAVRRSWKVSNAAKGDVERAMTADEEYKLWCKKFDGRALVFTALGYMSTTGIYAMVNLSRKFDGSNQ